ncbi:hypothetical protein [Plantactinospora soyae]|uniref:Uncharacterized protein n=1 Tax=Plantactinospora soyae TaxID=1544732 RepID=A0A927QYV8_9ACTN|nr:hypothetical protein [Plantactinospora soyae]MBE1488312.1 hypothetical protein [Plantactinospora soyae]
MRAAPHLSVRRHRVHVGPVGDRSAAARAGEHPDDPVPADARGDVETGGAKAPGNQLGGSLFLAGDLGVPVDVTAQLDQIVVQPRRHGVHQMSVDSPGFRTTARVRGPGCRQCRSRRADNGTTKYSAAADDATF